MHSRTARRTALRSRATVASLAAVAVFMSSLTAMAAFADDTIITPPDDLSISGDLKVGSTVSIAGGVWTPDTTAVTVVWSADGTVIDEPAGDEGDLDLALLPGMVGKVISADVTGTADGAMSVPVSLTTAPDVVQPGTFSLTPTPTISGTARVGAQVQALPGEWSPQAPDVAYQWSLDGAPIADATTAAYTPVAADQGHALTVAVTASADGYEPATEASDSVTVGTGTFGNTVAPTISGTARVGSKLTARNGTWAPAPSTFAYAWTVAGITTPVSTASTFTPTTAQRGKVLTLTVTATAPGYAPLSKKSPSVTIGAGVFTAPTPTVTGRAVIGSVLTVKPGTWTPSATKTYRWLRNGVAISTATSASYKVAAVDYGKRLSVVVTGTATGYTTLKKTSASTATVVKPFTRTTAPTITGSVHVLSVLSAHRTAWSPYVSTYSWQWKRNGVAITGATGAAYRLTTADYGKKITVTLTGRRGGYATTLRTSAATFTVAGPAAVITKSGTYKVGTQIKPGTYAANSGPDCYWERDDASGYVGEGPGNVRGRTIVTIASTDKTFHTEGCGSWAPFVVLPGSATTAPSDGMYVVGSQVSAGTYTSTSTATCTWERLKDASGSDDSALGFGPFNERGRVIVTISSKDKYFATSGCGTWTKMPSTGTPAATAGDGMYAVGIHLQPGTYVNSGPAPVTCMASILTGFGGTMEEFLQGGITELPTSHKLQLTLLATDKGFFTSGCGTWTRIGP